MRIIEKKENISEKTKKRNTNKNIRKDSCFLILSKCDNMHQEEKRRQNQIYKQKPPKVQKKLYIRINNFFFHNNSMYFIIYKCLGLFFLMSIIKKEDISENKTRIIMVIFRNKLEIKI